MTFLSCSGGKSSGYNPDVGPFDKNGNYVEAWADNPPKRGTRLRASNPKPDPKPRLKPTPKRIAKAEPKPVSSWKTKSVVKPQPLPPPRPEPTLTPVPRRKPAPTANAKPKPTYQPKPKPKPSAVVVKPKTIRHVVKKGDTLYSISRKYGSSITKIKSANRLSGTTILNGSTLIVPR